MRVLVTGGAGFVGAYLVPALLQRGHEVTVFDATAPSALASHGGRVEYIGGDLGTSADVEAAMAACRPQGVFHLGAVLAGPCEENPRRGFAINFGSTQVLLDASVRLGVRKFFLVSSIAVFGRDAPEPVTDDAAKNPETVYGQTKLACEHLLQWYAAKRGLDACALRFTWLFGPGRTTGITALYSSLILDAIARGEPVTIPNPDERGDWLYVKDAVKAMLAAWDATGLTGRVLNVAGGVHSIREVVDIACRLRPDARVAFEGGASLSPYPVAYDDTPARRALRWKPDYTIEQAVAEHLRTVANA